MTIAEMIGGWWNAKPQAAADSPSVIASWGTNISDALGQTLSLFDNGLNVYMGVAERVQAMRLLNQQIAENAKKLITPTPSTQISDFLKNNGGMIAAGAIGIVLVGALVFRK